MDERPFFMRGKSVLSFRDYLERAGRKAMDAFRDFLFFGGMPELISMEESEKACYLSRVAEEAVASCAGTEGLAKPDMLLAFARMISATSGSVTNPNKLRMSLPEGSISAVTAGTYLSALLNCGLFCEAKRYDVNGKRFFGNGSCFYASNQGVLNALARFTLRHEALLKNAIFLFLKAGGFISDTGVVVHNERDASGRHVRLHYIIDFIARRGEERIYIRVRPEAYALSLIRDSFRKILISENEYPHYDEMGIFHTDPESFLLGNL